MNPNLRIQSDGGTVGRAVVEFHAQNIFPVMCQVFRCNEHRGIVNVAGEGSGTGHCTQRGPLLTRSHLKEIVESRARGAPKCSSSTV